MKRSKTLLQKRQDFVMKYLEENQSNKITAVVKELSDRLFLTERTIYNIISNGTVGFRHTPKPKESDESRIVEVGDTVRHVRFGEGEVVEKKKKHEEYIVTINFNTGRKSLLLRFSKLEIIRKKKQS